VDWILIVLYRYFRERVGGSVALFVDWILLVLYKYIGERSGEIVA
jgi:hypothetical protein